MRRPAGWGPSRQSWAAAPQAPSLASVEDVVVVVVDGLGKAVVEPWWEEQEVEQANGVLRDEAAERDKEDEVDGVDGGGDG